MNNVKWLNSVRLQTNGPRRRVSTTGISITRTKRAVQQIGSTATRELLLRLTCLLPLLLLFRLYLMAMSPLPRGRQMRRVNEVHKLPWYSSFPSSVHNTWGSKSHPLLRRIRIKVLLRNLKHPIVLRGMLIVV